MLPCLLVLLLVGLTTAGEEGMLSSLLGWVRGRSDGADGVSAL